jgi:spore maturation protein CgeB
VRVLAVEPGPHFSVLDVHRGLVGAMTGLGVDVASLNLGDRLTFYLQVELERAGRHAKALSNDAAVQITAKGVTSAAFEFWPDVVLITSCFFIPRETIEVLRARGMKVVMLFTESPYEDDGQIARAPFADLVLLNDPTNLDRFRQVNPNTHYLPHAYDPAVHRRRPANPAYASDFCFVGTGFPSRRDLFEAVDWSGIDVCLAGNWKSVRGSKLEQYVAHDIDQCLDNAKAVDLYSNCKASANTYRTAGESERPELADGWAMSPREVELAATGTFFLRQSRGEGDEVLPMLPTFDGPADFEAQLRWWLAHDDEREAAAAAARAAVAGRTFEANARRVLGLIEAL